MVDVDMAITAKHERVVASELVGVDDATAPHLLDQEVQERACLDVHPDHSVTLQYAESSDFSGGPACLFLCLRSSLVHLDDSAEELGAVWGVDNDGSSYHVDRLDDRRISQTGLLGDLPCRKLQLEELYYPVPILVRDPEPVYPPPSEVVEGVSAPLAPEPSLPTIR